MNNELPLYKIPDSYQLVYNTSFKDTYVNPSSKILLNVWNPKSEFISEDEFKEDGLYNIVLTEKYNVEYLIGDITYSKFVVTPELQLWYANQVIKGLIDIGLLKIGVIMDADLNMLSSLEEIAKVVIERMGSKTIPYRYFSNLESALKWA